MLYVLPTFGWSNKTEGTWSFSARGGGLRVCLDRPWFSSGAGELLGVVLWGCVPPQQSAHSLRSPSPTSCRPAVTQWGMDPVWDAPPPPSQAVPRAAFPQRGRHCQWAHAGMAAGHGRRADRWRDLRQLRRRPTTLVLRYRARSAWPISPSSAWRWRYQPKSLPDAHLSRVVLADYAQLVPDRAASIAFDGFDPTLLQLAVTGVVFGNIVQSGNVVQSLMQVTVETQVKTSASDASVVRRCRPKRWRQSRGREQLRFGHRPSPCRRRVARAVPAAPRGI